MGGFGPSCDRGNGDGSSGFSSRLLLQLQLPSQLACAREPEPGLVLGSVVLDAMDGEVVVGFSCCVVPEYHPY